MPCSRPRRGPFLNDFLPFQQTISRYGMYNSLSQTLLKICAPGVPDFYQGAELWNFSLVDPDNRRPVDYGTRVRVLKEIKNQEAEAGPFELARKLMMDKESGAIKQYLIYKALNYRKANRRYSRAVNISLWTRGRKGAARLRLCAKNGKFHRIGGSAEVSHQTHQRPEDFPFGIGAWENTGCSYHSRRKGRASGIFLPQSGLRP